MQKSKLQLKIQKYLIIVVLVLVAMPVFAAEVSFDTKTQETKVNQLFEVGFFIDTDEESINAIEGKITFPQNLLEVKEVNDGNSIINFWIERPKVVNGEITFSGIIPGGYFDKRGLIFSLVFQSSQEGRGSIEIRDIETLINDGQGTEAKTTTSNLQFVISNQALPLNPATVEKKDTTMPEAFEPAVASGPVIFGGKYFLVFSAQDKGSGIDHYEIQENRKEGIKNKKWITGESPYLLKDQGLKSYIYVKAIDKRGNERIVVLPPQKPLSWYQNYWILGILITMGLIIAGISLRKIVWRKWQKFIKSR